MPFITVSKGGPATEIPDGVYAVTLVDIQGPRTVTAQRGPKAGQDIDLLDWTFAINEGQAAAGAEVDASTSTASGPRSKLYGFLVALFGGKTPPPGTGLEKEHLIGREAIATVRTDENGWPRIDNLGAVPNTMPLPVAQVGTPAAPQAPVQPTSDQAVVPAARARRQPPVSEAPRYTPEGGLVPGTGPQQPAPVTTSAAGDNLPF